MDASKRKPAKKTAAKKRPARKPRQPKPAAQNLPAPLDVQADHLPVADPQPSEGWTLKSKVAALFQKNVPTETPSEISSASTSGDPLPAEAQALLDSVPDVVGNGVPGEPGPDGTLPSPVKGESGTLDPIGSMLANVTFKEEHVKRILSSLFDFIATKLDDEGLKLTGWKLEMVGEPTAQMANAMWAAFMAKMPDFVSKWCETTPGASAFMAAWGTVGTIMVVSHMHVVSERKNKHTTADPTRPATTTQAVRPGPTAIHSQGGIQWAENMHG